MGYPFHRENHFSVDGTQLLRERAKAIRPDMDLDIDEPDTDTSGWEQELDIDDADTSGSEQELDIDEPPRTTTTASHPRTDMLLGIDEPDQALIHLDWSIPSDGTR
jgi:hypothetical protein